MTSGVATAARQQSKAVPAWFSTIAQILIVAVLIYVLFWDVLAYMASDWWNYDAYSQGMALPPLALYVAWLHRHRTFSYDAVRDYRGVALTSFACLLYLVGKLASEFFLMRFSFVLLLIALIWSFWGIQRLKTLTFPLLLLATMVPLPSLVYNSVAAPLQLLASDISAIIAQHLGVSVYRDGNILQLANVTLGVAEACSGLNSLSALIVGSVLLGYLICTGVISRTLLFIAAIPLAIAVNILRVAGTAVLADYNEEFAIGFYHLFSGWLVFVAGFSLLYVCAKVFHALLDRNYAR